MQKFGYAPLAALFALALSGPAALAQTAGTVTFTANQTSAQGGLTPVLTWSTAPVATSCVASGAWTGTKFASGSETLARITSSKAYTLTCTWGNGSATVNWTPPTRNTDNTTLTNLASYKVAYGRSATDLSLTRLVNDTTARSAVVPALASGTWYFAVRAVNSAQRESTLSNVATKTIAGASAVKTVNITITAAPPPPTPSLRTVRTSVYDVVRVNDVRTRGRVVGSIALGKPCQSGYQVQTTYYRVTNSDVTLNGTAPRSTSLITRCTVN